MSIRLTIDAMPILAGGGGISNYTCPLLSRFCRDRDPEEIRITFHWRVRDRARFERAAARISAGLPEYPGAAHTLTRLPDRLLAAAWRTPAPLFSRLTLPPTDVYLATTNLLPAHARFRRIGIVHDMMQAVIPQFFRESREHCIARTRAYCRACNAVIAVSRNTARDIVELCGIPEEQITVIYPGPASPAGRPEDDAAILEKLGIRPPFMLYLGALARNKNIDGLLRAFGAFRRRGFPEWRLAATGRNFVGKDFLHRICREEGITDHVIFTGWIRDEERWALLRRTEILLQFSWYEGFGLPVLEALTLGKPALISNRGPFPEILPNPEQLVDPADPEAAGARMAEFAASPEMQARWSAFMRRRARDFSWARSAALLEQVVRRVAAGETVTSRAQ